MSWNSKMTVTSNKKNFFMNFSSVKKKEKEGFSNRPLGKTRRWMFFFYCFSKSDLAEFLWIFFDWDTINRVKKNFQFKFKNIEHKIIKKIIFFCQFSWFSRLWIKIMKYCNFSFLRCTVFEIFIPQRVFCGVFFF